MSKVPSLSYTKIIAAFERDGWVRVRQRGSYIRFINVNLTKFSSLN